MSGELPDPGPPQLTLDGGEVPTEHARATSTRGGRPDLTVSQRQIVERIRRAGSIRSVEAGVIVHAHRGRPCGYGAKGTGPTSLACCHYAAADGLSAMQRLEKRGLIQRGETVGVWVLRTEEDDRG